MILKENQPCFFKIWLVFFFSAKTEKRKAEKLPELYFYGTITHKGNNAGTCFFQREGGVRDVPTAGVIQ